MKSFDVWAKEYALEDEPNYSAHTRADCLAAYKAGIEKAIETLMDMHTRHVIESNSHNLFHFAANQLREKLGIE